MVTQYDNSKRSAPIATPRPQTDFFIREPPTDQTIVSSSDDDDSIPLRVTFPTQSTLTTRGTPMVRESSNGMAYDQGCFPKITNIIYIYIYIYIYNVIFTITAGIQAQSRLSIPTQSTLKIGGSPEPVESSDGMWFQTV